MKTEISAGYTGKRKHSAAIDLIKCIAVLLVLNNHMGQIYPISGLAFGGALGNALFFAVSGYTWSNVGNMPFSDWYAKKIKRIWLPTCLTNLLYVLIFLSVADLSLRSLFRIFVYPNKSWFCGAILLYAVLYFILAKKYSGTLVVSVILGLGAVYGAWYILFVDKTFYSLEGTNTGGVCRAVHYLLCMISGLVYQKSERKVPDRIKQKLLPSAFALFVLSYAGKFLIGRVPALLNFQFIIQASNLACAICFLAGGCYWEEKLQGFARENPLTKACNTIARYSWEAYLVQTLIIPLCVTMQFPLNLAVCVIAVCISAWLLKAITNWILRTERSILP